MTSTYMIVTIPIKLNNGSFWTMGKVANRKFSFSELFISFFFFWLNSRISLTGVHPHIKFGRDVVFGDMQGPE